MWFADIPIAVRLVSQAPRGLNESPAADPRRAPETILCGDTHIRSREAESVRGLPGHRRERPRRHRRTHRLVECRPGTPTSRFLAGRDRDARVKTIGRSLPHEVADTVAVPRDMSASFCLQRPRRNAAPGC